MPSRPYDNVVRITSLLLWVPHAVGILINSIDNTPANQVKHLCYSILCIATTFFVSRRFTGDVLMLTMFFIGLLSELLVIGYTPSTEYFVPRNGWVIISGVQGLIAGILCKSKDSQEGRFHEVHSLGERMHVITPFTVGIWCAYVLMNGLGGLVQVFSSVFFCLALVGYGVIAYRALSWSGVFDMDLIAVVNHMFTTSFGVVFLVLLVTFVVVSYLAIPFAASLLELNGVLSSLGILVELVVYDNAA
jgi:hypothetical protein